MSENLTLCLGIGSTSTSDSVSLIFFFLIILITNNFNLSFSFKFNQFNNWSIIDCNGDKTEISLHRADLRTRLYDGVRQVLIHSAAVELIIRRLDHGRLGERTNH